MSKYTANAGMVAILYILGNTTYLMLRDLGIPEMTSGNIMLACYFMGIIYGFSPILKMVWNRIKHGNKSPQEIEDGDLEK